MEKLQFIHPGHKKRNIPTLQFKLYDGCILYNLKLELDWVDSYREIMRNMTNMEI